MVSSVNPKIFLLALTVLSLAIRTSNGAYRRNSVDPVAEGSSGKAPGCWSVYTECKKDFAQQYKFFQQPIDYFIYRELEYKKILKVIENVGLDNLCLDIGMARSCYNIQSKEQNCWIDSRNANPYELFTLQDYLCEDSVKNDLKQHWNCFFNPEVFERLETCMVYFINSTRACDPRPMEACLEQVLDTSSQCQAGAGRVAKQVITKSLFILAHCSARDACLLAMSDCNIYPAQLYNKESPFDMARRSTGPGEFCRELLRTGECAKEQLNLETCAHLTKTPRETEITQTVIGLPEQICVQDREDLEEHWDCFRDLQAQDETKPCMKRSVYPKKDHCKESHVAQCVRDAISSNPSCKPGAENIIAEVYVSYHYMYYYTCSDVPRKSNPGRYS